jgi:methyl-accepting chemotaxis protein
MNATIAMDGVRVTTNVRLRDDQGTQFDERALGTLYSDKVMQSLTAMGTYRGRAPVVAQWQRTMYRALTDYQGHMIAAAYAGIPEAYFTTVSRDFTRSLQFASLTGGTALLIATAVALWLLRRSIVLPLRRFAAQLATGDGAITLDHAGNDEVGDVAAAMQQMLNRWQALLSEIEAAGTRLSAGAEALCAASAAAGSELGRTAAAAGDPAAAAQMRAGAAGATTHLQRLSEALKTVGEGVRREERSVFYIGRVAEEIATGLTESKGMVDSALADVGELTAAARGALRLAGEFAAGLTMLRQDLQAAGHHPRGLDLLQDPSELLGSLATLSERVAEEVRLLVLIVQENQARLAFIREEMIRVAGVVHTTSAATHEATASAGAVIGWMEGMAGSAVSVADEALAAHSGLSELAEANRRLHALCGEIQGQAEQFRKLVDELKGKA